MGLKSRIEFIPTMGESNNADFVSGIAISEALAGLVENNSGLGAPLFAGGREFLYRGPSKHQCFGHGTISGGTKQKSHAQQATLATHKTSSTHQLHDLINGAVLAVVVLQAAAGLAEQAYQLLFSWFRQD